MQNKKYKIGICGTGMVGGAIKKYFENKQDYEVFSYDKGKNEGSMEEVNKADYIYICVPTPFDKKNGCDTSIVRGVVNQIKDGKVVIIKSTVIPGTTEAIQSQRPELKMMFNPEFLTEITADQDMNYPDRQIIGYTKESYKHTKDVIQQLPLAPFERIMPASEAEMVKYFGNVWFSTKVIFANQIYDICEKAGIDYDTVMAGAAADKRIGRTHLKVMHRGYRGYGNMKVSKCLPKDTKALIKLANRLGVNVDGIKATDKMNDELWEKYGNENNVVADKDIEFTSGGDVLQKK